MAGDDQTTETNGFGGGEPLPSVEVSLDQQIATSRTPWGAIVGAGALIVTLGVGAIALTGGDSEIGTAPASTSEGGIVDEDNGERAEDDQQASADEEGADSEAVSEPSDAVAEPAFVVEEATETFDVPFEDAAFDSEFRGPTQSQTVFDGERFVSLVNDGDEWALRTSVNGLEWAETPVEGLPDDGFIYNLIFSNGAFVSTIDTYDVDTGSSSQSVVSSTDGLTWTVAPLPDAGENAEAGISGFVVLDDRVILVRNIYNTGPDPVELLIGAGILDENGREEFCGFDTTGERGPISVLVCSYEEFEEFGEFEGPTDEQIQELADRYDAATTDEERQAIEDELERLWGEPGNETAAVIEPGDPLYDEIYDLWFGPGTSGEMSASLLAGPFAGPFAEVGSLPADSYLNGLTQIDSALFASLESYDDIEGNRTTILTSTDGAVWNEVSSPSGVMGGSLQAAGDTLIFMAYSETGGTLTFVSTDGAQSWTEAPLETSLFESYTQFLSGEVGTVAFTSGLLEPFEDSFGFPGPAERPVLERDGFELEVDYNVGTYTLRGPDGAEIYVVGEEELYGDDTSDAVRMNPISGALTWLDPETGEDLVTFTDDDWEAAYEEIDQVETEFYDGGYEEPQQGFELQFSPDGTTWTELDASELIDVEPNTSVQPLAVGDDEVVISLTTYNEPPEELWAFEIEGREPTDAERDALQLWEATGPNISYVRIPLA